jgi:hypothetical protein
MELVNVAPVAERLVVEAFVAVRLVMNAEVKNAPTADTFVVEALLIVAVPVVFELSTESPVAERLVVEAVVKTEDDANTFWEKVLRKRRVEEPSP